MATDRRTVRTRKALKDAMLTLIQKRDISKITVSDLTELADIGRGTFYLHYQDPYDLLDKIEDEIIENVHEIVNEHYGNDDSESMLLCLEKVWGYLYENKAMITALAKNPTGYGFVEKCKAYFFRIMINNLEGDELASYRAIYVISGSWGIFQQWIWDDMKQSPKEIAKILKEVIGTK